MSPTEDKILTPEEKKIQADIRLLQTIHLAGLSKEAQEDFRQSIFAIESDYREALTQAANKNATDEVRAYNKALAESIAKSLPDITRGALSAAAAFRRGDNMSGSAALMDICAAVVPVLSVVLDATGAGAFVGALFSVVGQLLAFFAPAQPTVTEQLQEMLDKIEANTQFKELKGIQSSI